MDMREKITKGILVIEIDGSIDLYNCQELRTRFEKHREFLNVIIDLGGLDYIDSSGIGVLILALSGLRKRGGSLKLVNVGNPVLTVFKLTRLTSFFEFHRDQASALS